MYEKIALISPYVEVELRKIYWKNVGRFKKFRPKRTIAPKDDVSWDQVVSYFKQNGIINGTLMVLHSSYEALQSSNLSPIEIISSLRSLLGNEGTLAMPVIRKYKNEPPIEHSLNIDLSNTISTYNPQVSKIVTGILPFYLTKEKGAIISRYPLNSMAAIGRLAVPMMADNIIEDDLPPCGRNSSWAFCVENDAIVVGLGIDLTHSLTILHVAEDLFMEEWPIKNWYRKRVFDIVDGDFYKRISVLERKPVWGCFYYAELNLRNSLRRNKILISKNVGGVAVDIVHAKKLIDFLRLRNSNGYPYCIPKKYYK